MPRMLQFLFSSAAAVSFTASCDAPEPYHGQRALAVGMTDASVPLTEEYQELVDYQTTSFLAADTSVSGDFDGDGLQDHVVGDWRYNAAGEQWKSGQVLVYPTSTCGEVAGAVPSLILRPGEGGLPGQSVVGGKFGFSLATGDLNGDGYDDLAIGMPGNQGNSYAYAGAVYLLYGSPTGLDLATSQRIDQASPSVWGTAEGGDSFGYSLAINDFNNDGFGDIAVGVPFEGLYGRSQVGAVQILFGSDTGPSGVGDAAFYRGTSGLPGPSVAGDRFGYSLAAGHFSDSSYAGLAVSAPRSNDAATNAGALYLFDGGPSGLSIDLGNSPFHENSPGVISAASSNEQFGYKLRVWNENSDGRDDLLVENRWSTACSGTASHLFLGAEDGLSTIGDLYSCGQRIGPRFNLEVADPRPPAAYAPPSGQDVVQIHSVAQLVAALGNDTAETLVLDDGIYSPGFSVRPRSADKIWARNAGAAVFQFGLYYQWKYWADDEVPEVHGITFDIPVDLLDEEQPPASLVGHVLNGETGLTSGHSLILVSANDNPTDNNNVASSLVVEDCFFYGHDWIDQAILVARPDDLRIERIVVRDTHDFGVSVSNTWNTPSKKAPIEKLTLPNHLQEFKGLTGIKTTPSVFMRDLDIAGVFKPEGEAGHGPGDNYFCRQESGLILAGIDEIDVERVRVRDTRCGGINLGVNRDETVQDAGHIRDLNIDCAGFSKEQEVETSEGEMRPVRSAGLYLQYASSLDIASVFVGPNSYDGIRSEFTGQEVNNNLFIFSALLQARRSGIAMDKCTKRAFVDNFVIERAECAGVIDNNDYENKFGGTDHFFWEHDYEVLNKVTNELEVAQQGCGEPYEGNAIGYGVYRLVDIDEEEEEFPTTILTVNANQCPDIAFE